MNISDIEAQISVKDFDRAAFVRLAVGDSAARDEIMRLLVTHPHIMVYFQCYYVADDASAAHPELFYVYWDTLTPLLAHPNSYHRDIALTLLANLSAADAADRFAEVLEPYLACLRDAKFMTAECCIRNCAKLLNHKPALKGYILSRLMDAVLDSPYTPKQVELLKAAVLEVIVSLPASDRESGDLTAFIQHCQSSPSPKTRRLAKALLAA
jgi:hypothetical protein